MIWILAVADFRERVRGPAYVITLLVAVALGTVAVPAADSRWVVLNVGEFRGVYTSAYVGTLMALASTVWLTLGGFYVVRNAVVRDERTGVGQLLAATPLRMSTYLAGKYLSNILVLASMLALLVVTALVLQLVRGESGEVNLWALLSPFIFVSLPVVAVTAAAALVSETIRPLRAGVGNVAWFFVWMVGATAGQSPGTPLGGLGVGQVALSMREDLVAQGIPVDGLEFSLGLMYVEEPLRTFEWSGLQLDAPFVINRLLLVVLATMAAVSATLWFGRFDPARRSGPRRLPAAPSLPPVAYPQPDSYPGQGGLRVPAPLPALPAGGGVTRLSGRVRRGAAPGRLLSGEFRILIQGVPWWWWTVVALLAVTTLVLPERAVPLMLPVVWVWPLLVWSRLGTQQHEHDVASLLAAYPGPIRRLASEWGAGIVFTALIGAAPLVRMIMAGDGQGAGAWLAGAVFIPSLALLLGCLSRAPRLFQAVYLCLWYTLVNGFAAVDFMGAIRNEGALAGPSPVLVGLVSLAGFAVVLSTDVFRRHAGR